MRRTCPVGEKRRRMPDSDLTSGTSTTERPSPETGSRLARTELGSASERAVPAGPGGLGLGASPIVPPETKALPDPRIVQIVESISDSFMTVDREWRFTYVNRHALELSGGGVGMRELLGRNLWETAPVLLGTE